MPSFAKKMELCEVLPKIYSYVLVLPNLWSYAKFFPKKKLMKFCQKYKVMC
jgi:hypothetical protein